MASKNYMPSTNKPHRPWPKVICFFKSNPKKKKKNTSVHPTKETVNRCSSFRSNKCDRCCRASTRLNQLYKITERDVISDSIFTIIHHLELVSLISTPKMHLDLPNLFHLSLELFNLFIHLLQHPSVIHFPKSLVIMSLKKTLIGIFGHKDSTCDLEHVSCLFFGDVPNFPVRSRKSFTTPKTSHYVHENWCKMTLLRVFFSQYEWKNESEWNPLVKCNSPGGHCYWEGWASQPTVNVMF